MKGARLLPLLSQVPADRAAGQEVAPVTVVPETSKMWVMVLVARASKEQARLLALDCPGGCRVRHNGVCH